MFLDRDNATTPADHRIGECIIQKYPCTKLRRIPRPRLLSVRRCSLQYTVLLFIVLRYGARRIPRY